MLVQNHTNYLYEPNRKVCKELTASFMIVANSFIDSFESNLTGIKHWASSVFWVAKAINPTIYYKNVNEIFIQQVL
jgi:hypothetical protein